MVEPPEGKGDEGGANEASEASEAKDSGAALRPSFATDFPRDPELDRLVDAFVAGDFARVRTGAPELAGSAKDDAVKRAAETLLARTKADPLQTLLVAISALLLVLLTAWWITHSGKG
ncbi:MAG: hypothetical protein ACLQVI_37545 [Polyangiaceae bacterium]